MPGFFSLLRTNRNYRFGWLGQIVSEVGDHFNNIAVLSLALDKTHSGAVVAAVMLSRAIPAVLIGPFAGVLLDRFDRRKIMLASDLVRGCIALGFIAAISFSQSWLLYVLSAALMAASPFFSSGRSAILPTIATESELHTANSLTQTTGWVTLAVGAYFGGTTAARFGYELAFVFNSASFFFSAFCIFQLRSPTGDFRGRRVADNSLNETKGGSAGRDPAPPDKRGSSADLGAGRESVARPKSNRPWHEYREGLGYMLSTPLIMGIGLIAVGWASGGGAAQVLFSLFNQFIFKNGAQGLGQLWGIAGVGLLIGGIIGNRIGKSIGFEAYKRTVFFCYLLHGSAYIVFSQMRSWGWALFFMGLSRGAVAVSSVLNWSKLLERVENRYRGRVFSTVETMTWSTMMLSMLGAGVASQYYSPRLIGVASGLLSSSTALFWGWANWTGKLPEPGGPKDIEAEEEVEIHGDPAAAG